MSPFTRIGLISTVICLGVVRADAAFTVVPPGNAATAGNRDYGFTIALTSQQVYGSNLLSALPTGSVIDGISFRLAPGQLTNMSAITATNFDVYLGTSNFAPGSLSSSVAGNEGADTVLARSGSLTFAADSFPGGAIPNGFGPEITFTTPYTYTGGNLLLTLSYSIPTGGGLLFDAQDGVNAQEVQGNGYNSATAPSSANGAALIVQFDYSTPAAVPEPGSLALVGIGGVIGVTYARVRRRKVAG